MIKSKCIDKIIDSIIEELGFEAFNEVLGDKLDTRVLNAINREVKPKEIAEANGTNVSNINSLNYNKRTGKDAFKLEFYELNTRMKEIKELYNGS